MPNNPDDWRPAPVHTEKVADSDDARGWVNVETGEVVIRQPLLEDSEELPAYGVYFFTKVSKVTGRGTNRALLFRDDDPKQADERLRNWLERVDTPTDPARFDTAIHPTEVRRSELSHVSSLQDWAHLTGAEYYISEKIGSRKRSGGSVALFDGSHRWGEGAYVAIASVDGPGGQEFASVGYQPGDYYTTDQRLGTNPFEISSPTVEFDGETLHVSSSDNSREITVTAQTDTPNHCLNTGN